MPAKTTRKGPWSHYWMVLKIRVSRCSGKYKWDGFGHQEDKALSRYHHWEQDRIILLPATIAGMCYASSAVCSPSCESKAGLSGAEVVWERRS